MRARVWVVVPLWLALPGTLWAQGLGDAAARERVRREAQPGKAGGAGRSFSNEDLEGEESGDEGKKKREADPTPPPSYSSSETSSSETPEAEAEEPSPTPDEPTPDEPTPAQRVAELEGRVKALQDKLNPFSGSYIYGPFGSNDPTEEPRTRAELQRLEAELAKAREEAARPPAPARREERPAPH